MPTLAMYSIQPPREYEEFERICKDYLSRKYGVDASLYGRRGQKQNGIDIIISSNESLYYCAQCKDYKAVSEKQLDEWIIEADNSPLPIKELIIFVAIETDSRLQEHICIESSKRVDNHQFPIKLVFWNDIVDHIRYDKEMLRMYYPCLFMEEKAFLKAVAEYPYDDYPSMIEKDIELLNLFFSRAVKYSIEEFLRNSATLGVDMELIWDSELFINSLRIIMFRSPVLTKKAIYIKIDSFFTSFYDYCSFLPNVTEVILGSKAIARNKYHTIEEKEDIEHAENLRNQALNKYLELKELI